MGDPIAIPWYVILVGYALIATSWFQSDRKSNLPLVVCGLMLVCGAYVVFVKMLYGMHIAMSGTPSQFPYGWAILGGPFVTFLPIASLLSYFKHGKTERGTANEGCEENAGDHTGQV